MANLELDKSRAKVLVVDGSQTGKWIPSSGGIETILAADSGTRLTSTAVVFSDSDIVESIRRELIQSRVKESKRRLSLSNSLGVSQNNKSGKRRSRGRSSRDLVSTASNHDFIVVSNQRDIRVTSSLGVEHRSWREIRSVLEVVGDNSGLVGWSVKEVGETSSGGDETSGVRGTSNFLASEFRSLGGTNSGDVRDGSRERWMESTLRSVTSGLEVGDTIITRSNNDGNSSKTKLAGFGGESGHVGLRVFLGNGAIRHRVNQWRVGGRSDSNNPVNKHVLRVGNRPVGGRGTLGNSHDVLDIKIGFSTAVRVRRARAWVVRSNDVGNLLGWDVEFVLESRQVRRRERLAKTLEQGLGGFLGSNSVAGDVVVAADEGRVGVTVGSGFSKSTNHKVWLSLRERDGVGEEVNRFRNFFWDGVGISSSELNLFKSWAGEVKEFSSQQFFPLANGGGGGHEFTVRGRDHVKDFIFEKVVLNSLDSDWVSEHKSNFFQREMLSIFGRSWVRKLVDKGIALSLNTFLVLDGKNNLMFLIFVSSANLLPVVTSTLALSIKETSLGSESGSVSQSKDKESN